MDFEDLQFESLTDFEDLLVSLTDCEDLQFVSLMYFEDLQFVSLIYFGDLLVSLMDFEDLQLLRSLSSCAHLQLWHYRLHDHHVLGCRLVPRLGQDHAGY
jgi:hypothetical protein